MAIGKPKFFGIKITKAKLTIGTKNERMLVVLDGDFI